MDSARVTLVKDIVAIVQSIATVIALAIGGGWAYETFLQQRKGHPGLQIQQQVTHFNVSKRYNMLVVDDSLTNVGPVLLEFSRRNVRVIQILPLPNLPERQLVDRLNSEGHYSEINDPEVWPVLEFREKESEADKVTLEPGEVDRLHEEFLIPVNVKEVTVFSQFMNPSAASKRLVWRTMSVHDMSTSKAGAGQK